MQFQVINSEMIRLDLPDFNKQEKTLKPWVQAPTNWQNLHPASILQF